MPSSRRPHRPLRWAALYTVFAALIVSAPSAAAERAPAVTLTNPDQRESVSGVIDFTAKVRGPATKLSFYVDGERRYTDHSRPWRFARSGRLDTTELDNGRHRLAVITTTPTGRRATDSVVVIVRNSGGADASDRSPASDRGPVREGLRDQLATTHTTLTTDPPRLGGGGGGAGGAGVGGGSGPGGGADGGAGSGGGTVTTAPSVAFRAPLSGQAVAGVLGESYCEVTASDVDGIDRVQFEVDGAPLNTERYAPWNCEWNTSGLADGVHELRATAYDRLGNAASSVVDVTVNNNRSSDPSPLGPALFSDSFECGGFTGAGCGGWYYGATETAYQPARVVTAAAAGIPAKDGADVARFEVSPSGFRYPAGDGQSKLFLHLSRGGGLAPTNVSGTYSVWYYLPANLSYPTSGPTSNIFQWKERRSVGGISDASWWIEAKSYATVKNSGGLTWHSARPTRDTAPVAYVRHRNVNTDVDFIALPLGRWFELRADLHAGQRIDFFIDGIKFHTGYESEFPTGIRYGYEFIWGVGHYGPAVGPYYGDQARISAPGTFDPLP